MIYVCLANGFEEIEALTPGDLLRRAGKEVRVVGVGGKVITGSHGIAVQTDITAAEIVLGNDLEMIVLPGGLPGATNLGEHQGLTDQIKAFAASGKKVAAICAAPMVLAQCGILDGREATIYPGMEEHLAGAVPTGANVTVCGNIITGRGPALAMEFALALTEELAGAEVRKQVAEGLLFD